jgi:hypothetical protein
MAINANHPFEELNGIRCAVVEKNCTQARVDFLKYILEGNGFEVVVVASPPPKAPPAAKPAAASEPAPIASATTSSTPIASPPEASLPITSPSAPETFTVGVTDVTFNATNAIFGRLLRSPDGKVVTMAYWQQKESVSRDDVPYYAR